MNYTRKCEKGGRGKRKKRFTRLSKPSTRERLNVAVTRLLIVLGGEKTCEVKKRDNVALIGCKNCCFFVEMLHKNAVFTITIKNRTSKKECRS